MCLTKTGWEILKFGTGSISPWIETQLAKGDLETINPFAIPAQLQYHSLTIILPQIQGGHLLVTETDVKQPIDGTGAHLGDGVSKSTVCPNLQSFPETQNFNGYG